MLSSVTTLMVMQLTMIERALGLARAMLSLCLAVSHGPVTSPVAGGSLVPRGEAETDASFD